MPLSVACPSCGRGHKAPDRAAGRTVACLSCGTAMIVPQLEPEVIDPAAILLQDDDSIDSSTPVSTSVRNEIPPSRGWPQSEFNIDAVPVKKSKTIDLAKLPPLTSNDPPAWRRHLHWVLVLALLPLMVSLLTSSEKQTILQKLTETLAQASPDEQIRIISRLDQAGSIDDLFEILPEKRFHGAFLSRFSKAHWLMALTATIIYLAFFMFLAADGSAKPSHVMLVGLFTATIGVGFLLLIQALASMTEGRILVGKSIVALIYLVLKFIAFSYKAAMDPDNGFLLSFFGFTLGVGLCEELVKSLPLFWHRADEDRRAWRGLFIWGLASGAGFGIAEGIMYSGDFYNGISGPGIYVIRFISCVALHAIWSGSVGILLYQKRSLFDEVENWYGWILPILRVIAIPAILHGLYDTCLKRDMNAVALLTAFASFGYLAFLFSRFQSVDDVAANEEMLREYNRRRKALA